MAESISVRVWGGAFSEDWGMRAIKSVLVVAGGFKRADPRLSEQARKAWW